MKGKDLQILYHTYLKSQIFPNKLKSELHKSLMAELAVTINNLVKELGVDPKTWSVKSK